MCRVPNRRPSISQGIIFHMMRVWHGRSSAGGTGHGAGPVLGMLVPLLLFELGLLLL